jgi:hypothetical protein
MVGYTLGDRVCGHRDLPSLWSLSEECKARSETEGLDAGALGVDVPGVDIPEAVMAHRSVGRPEVSCPSCVDKGPCSIAHRS